MEKKEINNNFHKFQLNIKFRINEKTNKKCIQKCKYEHHRDNNNKNDHGIKQYNHKNLGKKFRE